MSKVTIVSSLTTDLTVFLFLRHAELILEYFQSFQKQRNNSSNFKMCIESKFLDWYSFFIILPSISNSNHRPPVNPMWRKHQPHSKLKWKVVRTNFLISNLLKRNQHLLLPELIFFSLNNFTGEKGSQFLKPEQYRLLIETKRNSTKQVFDSNLGHD